jgi:predicted transcriptional regulator
MANSNTASSNKISLSADIVAAYVSRNSVTPVGLSALIESVHGALSKLGAVETVPKTEALVPAVPIRKSITPGFLICLDDGKKFKSLEPLAKFIERGEF